MAQCPPPTYVLGTSLPAISVPSKLCARTRLLETAHTHKFTAHKHNHDEAMLSVGKLGKIVFGLAETGLLNQGCGVDERKIGHLRT